MLEVLAGLGAAGPMGAYVLIPVRFDESLVTTLDPSALPGGWRVSPPSPAVQAIGDRWVADAGSSILRVPSVIVPPEWNFLLNPGHPDFPGAEIGDAEPVSFDPRLTT